MEKADQVRLNHELLIWRGFTLTNGVWSDPDGVTVDNGVPYFPESLDAIFKWLVPKLESYELRLNYEKHCAWVKLPTKYTEFGMADNSALAFCLAIQKLIRSK